MPHKYPIKSLKEPSSFRFSKKSLMQSESGIPSASTIAILLRVSLLGLISEIEMSITHVEADSSIVKGNLLRLKYKLVIIFFMDLIRFILLPPNGNCYLTLTIMFILY